MEETALTQNRTHATNIRFVAVMLLLFAGAALVGTWRVFDVRLLYGDCVFLSQLLDNIADSGQAISDVQDTMNDMLFHSGVLITPSEELCARPLDSKGHAPDLMPYHPYFILYALAPLTHFVPSNVLLPFLTAGGFFLLLGFVFSYLERKKCPFTLSVPFLVLLIVYPPWAQALQGQYYVERFFVPLMGLVLWLLHREDAPLWLLAAATAACALVTERTGIIAGVYLVGHSVLYWKLPRRRRIALALIGFACVMYAVGLISLYVDNPYYSSGGFLPHSPGELMRRLENPVFREQLYTFLFFSSPLLALGLGDWRALLLGVGVMIPNMVGTIGGAEKTGFATHYHTLYLPVLIWAAGSGLERMARAWPGVKARVGMVVGLCLFVVMLSTTAAPDGRRVKMVGLGGNVPLPVMAAKGLSDSFGDGYVAQVREMGEAIRAVVPEGVRVTTPEWGMPILEHNRSLYCYPLGLDIADYALLNHSFSQGEHLYTGAVTYLGSEELKKIDSCMNQRLRSAGYDVDNPVWVGAGRAIIKRGH